MTPRPAPRSHRGAEPSFLCAAPSRPLPPPSCSRGRWQPGTRSPDHLLSRRSTSPTRPSPRTRRRRSYHEGEICDAAVTPATIPCKNLLFDSFGPVNTHRVFAQHRGSRHPSRPARDGAQPPSRAIARPPPRRWRSRRCCVACSAGRAIEASAAQSPRGWRRTRPATSACVLASQELACRDKTGSGNYNAANDIGIFAARQPPMIVAAYYTGSPPRTTSATPCWPRSVASPRLIHAAIEGGTFRQMLII